MGKSPGTAQLCFPLRFLQRCSQDVGHTAFLGKNPFTGSLDAGKIYFLLAVKLGLHLVPSLYWRPPTDSRGPYHVLSHQIPIPGSCFIKPTKHNSIPVPVWKKKSSKQTNNNKKWRIFTWLYQLHLEEVLYLGNSILNNNKTFVSLVISIKSSSSLQSITRTGDANIVNLNCQGCENPKVG